MRAAVRRAVAGRCGPRRAVALRVRKDGRLSPGRDCGQALGEGAKGGVHCSDKDRAGSRRVALRRLGRLAARYAQSLGGRSRWCGRDQPGDWLTSATLRCGADAAGPHSSTRSAAWHAAEQHVPVSCVLGHSGEWSKHIAAGLAPRDDAAFDDCPPGDGSLVCAIPGEAACASAALPEASKAARTAAAMSTRHRRFAGNRSGPVRHDRR